MPTTNSLLCGNQEATPQEDGDRKDHIILCVSLLSSTLVEGELYKQSIKKLENQQDAVFL